MRAAIDPRIKGYAEIINLRKASPQFEQDVIDALALCILACADKPKRYSNIRKELLRVAKEAKAAELSLGRLRNALENFSPDSREALEKDAALLSADHLWSSFDSLSPAFREVLARLRGLDPKIVLTIAFRIVPFHAVSSVALAAQVRASALKGKDRGGAPQNRAFRMLILYLARAFKNATKRDAKVTWNPYKCCFEGSFIRFVEAVLPLACKLSNEAGFPLSHPSDARSRGRYVYELTRAGGPISKTQRRAH